jgi:uncharacterized protein YbaA (DUF1428 family)
MRYVDGYLLVVPKKHLRAYLGLAKLASRVWRSHGALEYREAFAEDMKVPCGIPFPKRMKAKPSEVVVFSWIVYKSRAHRDKVNALVMKDPRMRKAMEMPHPFDMNNMSFGGFEIRVEA